MRYLGAAALFICAMIAGFLQSVSVSAATLSASGEITITARVVPAHYVIVDSEGDIVEITSNTTELVTPQIFRFSITPNSEVPLTQSVREEYDKIMQSNQGKMGTIYKKGAEAISSSKQKPYLLTLQSSTLSLMRYFH